MLIFGNVKFEHYLNIPLIAACISRLGSFCSTMSFTRVSRIRRAFARYWQFRKLCGVMGQNYHTSTYRVDIRPNSLN